MSAEKVRLWLAHDGETEACADQKTTGEATNGKRIDKRGAGTEALQTKPVLCAWATLDQALSWRFCSRCLPSSVTLYGSVPSIKSHAAFDFSDGLAYQALGLHAMAAFV